MTEYRLPSQRRATPIDYRMIDLSNPELIDPVIKVFNKHGRITPVGLEETEMTSAQHFGNFFREVRIADQFTLKAVGQESGLSVNTLKGIERGDRATARSLGRLVTYWVWGKEALDQEDRQTKKGSRGLVSTEEYDSDSAVVLGKWVTDFAQAHDENFTSLATRADVPEVSVKKIGNGELVNSEELGAVLVSLLHPEKAAWLSGIKAKKRREVVVFTPEENEIVPSSSREWFTNIGGMQGIDLRLNSAGMTMEKLRALAGLSREKFQTVLIGRGSENDIAKIRAIVDNL